MRIPKSQGARWRCALAPRVATGCQVHWPLAAAADSHCICIDIEPSLQALEHNLLQRKFHDTYQPPATATPTCFDDGQERNAFGLDSLPAKSLTPPAQTYGFRNIFADYRPGFDRTPPDCHEFRLRTPPSPCVTAAAPAFAPRDVTAPVATPVDTQSWLPPVHLSAVPWLRLADSPDAATALEAMHDAAFATAESPGPGLPRDAVTQLRNHQLGTTPFPAKSAVLSSRGGVQHALPLKHVRKRIAVTPPAAGDAALLLSSAALSLPACKRPAATAANTVSGPGRQCTRSIRTAPSSLYHPVSHRAMPELLADRPSRWQAPKHLESSQKSRRAASPEWPPDGTLAVRAGSPLIQACSAAVLDAQQDAPLEAGDRPLTAQQLSVILQTATTAYKATGATDTVV